MNRTTSLLVAAGIDPRQGPADAAAMVVRHVALRIGITGTETPEEIIERRWCSSVEKFSELLTGIIDSNPRWGQAFGIRWPWFEADDRIISPGLPVRSHEGTEELGPDGAYSNDGEAVYREAAGRREALLHLRKQGSGERPEFSLLWFSETARFLLKGLTIEVDDLFSRTRAGLSLTTLERLLVRSNRVDKNILKGLLFEERSQPTTVEVARRVDREDEFSFDPEAYFRSRIDVACVTVHPDRVSIRDYRSEEIVFLATFGEGSWRLELVEGLFPYRCVELIHCGEYLVLRAELGNDVDIFSPGLRGRVVFDLNADLAELIRR